MIDEIRINKYSLIRCITGLFQLLSLADYLKNSLIRINQVEKADLAHSTGFDSNLFMSY